MSNVVHAIKNTSIWSLVFGLRGAVFQAASNGLSSFTPALSISLMLRVTRINQCCLAVAAIHESFSGVWSGMCSAAHISAVASSIGSIRPSNVGLTTVSSHSRNTAPWPQSCSISKFAGSLCAMLRGGISKPAFSSFSASEAVAVNASSADCGCPVRIGLRVFMFIPYHVKRLQRANGQYPFGKPSICVCKGGFAVGCLGDTSKGG